MELPSLTRPMLAAGEYWLFALASGNTYTSSGTASTSYRYVNGQSPDDPSPEQFPTPFSTQTGDFNVNWFIVVE